MQIESLLPAPRLSLPAVVRSFSPSGAAQSIWNSVSLRNRSDFASSQPTEDAGTGCQASQDGEALGVNAEQLGHLPGLIGELQKQLRQKGLEDDVRVRLTNQLSRVQGLLPASPSPKETSKFSMTTLTRDAPAGVRATAAELSDIGRTSPAQSNAVALPCSNDAVTVQQTSPTLRTTASTLFNSVSSLVQTHLQRLNQKVNQRVARQEQINSTAEPPPHTELEKLCHFERTSSQATRHFKPANSTLIIRMLKKPGFESNPNAGSYGPLHLAVTSRHPERVSALLDTCKGYIEVDRVSPFLGTTALGIAVENDDHACAGRLLAAGAAPRTEDFTLAARKGNVKMFHRLYQRWIQGERRGGVDLHPALHAAVTTNCLEIARHLLENGVALDPRRNEGLLDAAYKGHIDMMRLLLLHAPQGYLEPSDSSRGESYAVIQAALGANPEAVALLLTPQTDRGFVEAMVAEIRRSLQPRSLFDKKHYAPVISCLENWLHHTATAVEGKPAPALAAGQGPAGPSSPESRTESRQSKNVFRPSYSLVGAGMKPF